MTERLGDRPILRLLHMALEAGLHVERRLEPFFRLRLVLHESRSDLHTVTAAETVDGCLSRIIPLALEHGYECLLIADHGNSDYMINEDGTPNTAHTKNPVPCIWVSKDPVAGAKLRNGRLADVAPTLLALMGVEKPEVMTGEGLLNL